MTKHEEIEESNNSYDKRIKSIQQMIEEQQEINREMKEDIDRLADRQDQKKQTQELEKKMKQMNQKYDRDIEVIQDDMIKSKLEK